MTTEVFESVVLLESGQMDVFQKRFDALNKKAAKFGLPLVEVLSTQEVRYKRVQKAVGRGDDFLSELVPLLPIERPDVEVVLVHRVVIRHPLIQLGNWVVVGKLETAEDDRNLMFSVTENWMDRQILSDAAKHPIGCEHCNTKRKRNEGYLLRNSSDGQYKKVGSTCLSDFTGVDPASVLFLAQMSQFIKVFEGEFDDFGSSSRQNAIATKDYLTRVIFCAHQGGFVSSAKAREKGCIATYEEALGLPSYLQSNHVLMEKYVAQAEACRAEADEIISWVGERDGESSFDENIRVLLSNEAIRLDRKHLAFAAAAVAMFYASREKAKRELAPSLHVGEVGEKFLTELSVDRIIPIENSFSGKMDSLVLMRDRSGNHLRWRTSACPQAIKDVGSSSVFMEASFKVKAHAFYKEKKQTEVTHLKVVRWIDVDRPQPPRAGIAVYSIAAPGGSLVHGELPMHELVSRLLEMGVYDSSGDESGFLAGGGDRVVLHSIDGSEFQQSQIEEIMEKIREASSVNETLRERIRA